uniref:Tyrosine recombinase XerA n=1 Tax=Candidatus Methanophagaceae archaeon ANME-1 ERB6 TaxID=2759912 RepID=A0A7G9YUQ8_9EURY|nr:tyrosine recombinase XerA [Methanosarcinales archaeon ANME-1 ERB6]
MPKRAPDPITEEELNKILDAAIIRDRDYLLLRLLARTGIRIGELYGVYKREQGRWIYGIRKKDIDFGNKRLWVYSLRQRKYARREVLVDDSTIVLLKRYTEKMKPEDYVFRSISYRQIQRLPKKYAQLAGVEKNVTCHSLRHFFITHSWRKGIDIARLQYLAGHADFKTTMIYTHVTTVDDKNQQC